MLQKQGLELEEWHVSVAAVAQHKMRELAEHKMLSGWFFAERRI